LFTNVQYILTISNIVIPLTNIFPDNNLHNPQHPSIPTLANQTFPTLIKKTTKTTKNILDWVIKTNNNYIYNKLNNYLEWY